jgi:hypothetical protein
MRTSTVCAVAMTATIGATSACASSPPPAAKAATVERMQCEPGTATVDAEKLVSSTTVLSVEPIYSHVMTSNYSEERVNGAKLIVRPPQGITAEQMTRLLQCHSARVLLGQVSPSAIARDPYSLPDTWVNIDVVPEDGNWAITLRADSVRDNLAVFGRASRYADEHQLAAEPGLP